MGAHVVGLQADRLAERRLGLRGAVLPVERHTEAAVERGVVGAEPERLAVGGLGFEVAALPAEAEREVRARLEPPGPEPHRRAQRLLRLGVLPCRPSATPSS